MGGLVLQVASKLVFENDRKEMKSRGGEHTASSGTPEACKTMHGPLAHLTYD